MNRALLIGAAALIAFSGVTLPQSLPDRVIVPGQRVGPIAAGTVRADLTRLFPGAAIEDDEIELDEGLVQPATLVNKNNPSGSLPSCGTAKEQRRIRNRFSFAGDGAGDLATGTRRMASATARASMNWKNETEGRSRFRASA